MGPMAHISQMGPMGLMLFHGGYSFGRLYIANGLDGSHGSTGFNGLNGSYSHITIMVLMAPMDPLALIVL